MTVQHSAIAETSTHMLHTTWAHCHLAQKPKKVSGEFLPSDTPGSHMHCLPTPPGDRDRAHGVQKGLLNQHLQAAKLNQAILRVHSKVSCCWVEKKLTEHTKHNTSSKCIKKRDNVNAKTTWDNVFFLHCDEDSPSSEKEKNPSSIGASQKKGSNKSGCESQNFSQ